MSKFAHMSDIHLGAHREPALQRLELRALDESLDRCVELGVDFILISGDFFHVGIPDLFVVNAAVKKLRELHSKGIAVYAIYGSHDYNPASTSVIDIIETAGLLTNISKWREVDGRIRLDFLEDRRTGAKLTGLSARKIGLESKHYERLEKGPLEREGGFKVFAFHSGITEFKPPHLSEMDTIPISYLPGGFDYYAGGHIHERNEFSLPRYRRVVFPGPLFTGYGKDIEATIRGEKRGFYLVSFGEEVKSVEFVVIEGFDGEYVEFDATGKNSLEASKGLEEILGSLEVQGKVVALKVRGELSGGKTSDINFSDIRTALQKRGAIYVYLNRYAFSSKEYSQVRFVGEDIAGVERRLLGERIKDLSISQPSLRGERGVLAAQELLRVLRQNSRSDESKKAYQERIASDGETVLKLGEITGAG